MGTKHSLSVMGKRWHLRPANPHVTEAGHNLGLSDTTAKLLAQRTEFTDTEHLQNILEPSLKNLPDPSVLQDISPAVQRLITALKNNEKIAVFGDYDVDGSCGAALLLRYFKAAGADPILYIPDRLTEGYGPTPAAMETLKTNGANVIVTVDTGSLAFAALTKAQELGIDVIITDHHQTQASHPPCVALVNPNRLDDDAELGHLCGAGVAFLLIGALNRALKQSGYFAEQNLKEPDLRWLLDLVALATVADVMPLTGVNRIFVKRGLEVLEKRKNLGLSTLLDVAGLPADSDKPLDVFTLGFVLGPRLNAGGRLADCTLAARLLATGDTSEAQALAFKLNELNEERKAVEQNVLDEARGQAERIFTPDLPALVVVGEDWHPGVIGLTAARLKEQFYRPVFVLSKQPDGTAKCSARSIAGLDIGAAVLACHDHLLSGGGHAMAAGLTVEVGKIETFTEALLTNLRTQANAIPDVFIPSVGIDSLLNPHAVDIHLMRELERLEPHGSGWSPPRFCFSGVRLAFMRTVGNDNSHVKCIFEGADGSKLDAIAFRAMSTELGPFLENMKGKRVSVIGRIEKNIWQNRVSYQLMLEDATEGRWQGAATPEVTQAA